MQINYDKVAMDYKASGKVDAATVERLKPLMITMIKRYYPNFKEWDDLMQELRVITLEALLDFDPAHGAHALALIESRMKYHLLGKYKKQVVTTPLDDAFLVEDETSMDDFEALFYNDTLGEVFKELTYEEEKLIYLRYYTEMNYEDIGRALGFSRNTAARKINALLKKLRRLYKKQNKHTPKV